MMENVKNIRQAAAHKSPIDELMYIYGISPSYSSEGDALIALADAIEREIAERYMELPLDADGVPIHAGDEMTHLQRNGTFEVKTVMFNGDRWGICDLNLEGSLTKKPSEIRHVKPDPVRELLEEFADGIKEQNDDFSSLVIDKYAERLREVMSCDHS